MVGEAVKHYDAPHQRSRPGLKQCRVSSLVDLYFITLGLLPTRISYEEGRQLGGTALADRGRQLGAQHLQIRLRSVTQGRLALLEEDSRKRVALAAWKIPNSIGLRRYEERV